MPEEENNHLMDEFEEEFNMEKDHPLQALGAWLVVLISVTAMVIWIMSLMDILRR